MFWRGHFLFSMHSLTFPSKGQYQKTARSADQEKPQDLSTFNYYLQQPSFTTEKNLVLERTFLETNNYQVLGFR